MTERGWTVAGILLAFLGLGWQLWVNRAFFHDDAFISLRYARNLAEHGQLAWNLGEQVEGYTNFLHILATSGLIRMGLDPTTAAQTLNLAAAVLLILAVARGATYLCPTDGPARAVVLITAGLTPGVAIWTLGGLETVVVAACLAWGMVWVLETVETGAGRPATLAGVAFSLAVLTRLDAAVFIAGAGLATLLFAPRTLPLRFGLACLVGALPAAVAFAHMGWRLATYGLPFPLTFYAKTGVPYALRLEFLPELPTYALMGAPVILVALVATITGRRRAAVLAIPLLLHLAYVIWSGGDHMPAARVLTPLVGAAALILLTGHRTLPFAAAALGLAVVVMRPPMPMDPAAFVGTIVGRHLATLPAQTIVVATAGSTPYHATQHTFIDQLGLNDPVIAMRDPVPIRTPAQSWPGHAKGDGAYILSRKPTIIILGTAEGTTVDRPVFLSDLELSESAEFARCYAERTTDVPYGPNMEAVSPGRPNPIVFTWYERTC